MTRKLSPEAAARKKARDAEWRRLNPNKRAQQDKRRYERKKQETERLKQENEELKKQVGK